MTGGGRGIGEAVARRLAALGAKVAITGRTVPEIESVAADIGGHAVRADFAVREDVDRAITGVAKALGRVDILVNNAGIAESAPLERVTDAMWDRTLEINVTAPFRLCRELIPAMVDAGWGRVINVASNAGLSGYRYSGAYCASKHALVGLTRSLAVDYARTAVTVNAVCPGWVKTRLADEAVARIQRKTGRSRADARAALESMTPQQRMVEPEEVAHAVAMLCSHDARGIHGHALVIDGGQVMK